MISTVLQLTLANGRELVVESGLETSTCGGSHKQMVGIAAVLDLCAHLVTIERDHGGVGWLFGPAACLRLMLANEIEQRIAIGVAPEPTLRTIESGTVLIATRMIPERDRKFLAIHPLPAAAIAAVTHGAHPIL